MDEQGYSDGGYHDEEKELHEGTMVEGSDYEDDELSTEDLAESNNIIMSALIEVLVKKGVITQEELDKVVDEIQSEDDEDEEEKEGDASSEESMQSGF